MKLDEKTLGILLIGDELIKGKIADKNALLCSRMLAAYGITAKWVSIVGDSIEDIVGELRRAARQLDFLVCFGGLGPTSDDLTRYAVAEAAGVGMFTSAEAVAKLKAHAVRRGIELQATNLRQSEFPLGSELVANPTGTAEGFAVKISDNERPMCAGEGPLLLFALPGVPSEAQIMLEQSVVPRIALNFADGRDISSSAFRVFGIPESSIAERIEAVALPENVIVAYRPNFPEVLVELTFLSAGLDREQIISSVRSAVGEDYIYGNGQVESIAEVVVDGLRRRNETVTFAESCTGGMLASLLVGVSGASAVFTAGYVTYGNQVKVELLGVNQQTIDQYGAVSCETALEMARGARSRAGASYALAVSGIAGPDGGSEAKPVGTVCFACVGDVGEWTEQRIYRNTRNSFRLWAAWYALDILRRMLENRGAA
ncbi:MAG: CinA family nicotinamide mononucleotide deamidase-related protein [bacterium]|nr:CinA family nicotinamide mononucleotide deamidase-related protein [bacterium]